MKRAEVLIVIVAACTANASGKIIYVDDDAPPGGDGRSWQTAYRYSQDALQEGEPLPANPAETDPCTPGGPRVRATVSVLSDLTDHLMGTEIRVAQGIHRPDRGIRQKPGDRMATFRLTNGIALKGFFVE